MNQNNSGSLLHGAGVLMAALAILTQGLMPKTAIAAGSYPDKPVTVVVPYSAGGFTDIMARLLGKLLTEKWGSAVVVENVVGAGGNLGAAKVARAAPDGYTLLVSKEGLIKPF